MDEEIKDHSFTSIEGTPERVFVVGDIHGCNTEMRAMLEYLEEVAGLSSSDQVIFVGDYIDRGPNSKGVVSELLEFQEKYPSVVFLKGNHEDMLLGFLGFEGQGANFYLPNGGVETFDSYGISNREELENAFEIIPSEHIDFYRGLKRMAVIDSFVVVHAGLNPLRTLEEQVDDDIYWIRDEFIQNIHAFKKTVIFGHTPYQNVLFDLPYKIGIDTGLVFGNMLSCIELGTGQVYQIGRGDTEVSEAVFSVENTDCLGFTWNKS